MISKKEYQEACFVGNRFILIFSPMGRLKTNGKKKLRKALTRVNKVVIMDIRKQLDQQRKWKAEVVKRRQQG